MKNQVEHLAELGWHSPSASQHVTEDVAARYLGKSIRTLRQWRRSWRRAKQERNTDLRRGPTFHKVGRAYFYEVRHLNAHKALEMLDANFISQRATAKFLGVPLKVLQEWATVREQAQIEGEPRPGMGPKYNERGGRLCYDRSHLVDFLTQGTLSSEW